jgi:hypothetical protein
LCIKAFTPTLWEGESLLWIKLSIAAWWDLLLVVQEKHPGEKGDDKSPLPQSQQTSPQEILQESQAEIWDTEAV